MKLPETETAAALPPVTLNAKIFNDVDVTLSASLGHGTMTVRDLLDLRKDGIVTLETPLNGTVTLMLNDRAVAIGELVAVGDHFGVRIVSIINSED